MTICVYETCKHQPKCVFFLVLPPENDGKCSFVIQAISVYFSDLEICNVVVMLTCAHIVNVISPSGLEDSLYQSFLIYNL